MNTNEINIRDPFILNVDGVYYMYGTRADNFGKKVGGFDVYISLDLEVWSDPVECFNSVEQGLNTEVNWAPEVHRYKGKYYMFATFTQKNGLRGSYVLKADSPLGPFTKHSDDAVTPHEWECLDATLYISPDNTPYLVFCHEHTQIIDGTICYLQMSEDLTRPVSEAKLIFAGSSPYWADKKAEGEHYITDGPFLYRTQNNRLVMIWSTFVKHQYCQCIAKSDNDDITGNFEHLPLLIDNDGGHGMIFKAEDKLMLTFHTPNKSGKEHPAFKELTDSGEDLKLKFKR